MPRIFSAMRFCAGALTLLLSVAAADALSGSNCLRRTVGFYSLSSELTRIYPCTATPLCEGLAVDFETKQISMSGGQINQWLVVTTNSNASYTKAQQDAIMFDAKSLASANKPPLKYVYDIDFFWDVIVPLDTVTYFIGADVTYARCIKPPPSPFR